MRVLIVKTSSMGDVVHATPALTDMLRAVPGLQVDWLVEQPFAAIPGHLGPPWFLPFVGVWYRYLDWRS